MSRPLVKIGDVCALMTGGTPKTSIQEYYNGGTVPWIVSGDIHKEEIYDCAKRITELAVEKSNARYLPKDSVLIALNGQGKTRGKVALLRIEGATCNQSIVSINPNDKNELSSDYLFYYLKSQYQQIRNITGDRDRAGLNMPLIRGIEIPLPPIFEQERIAVILNKADTIRRKRLQSIKHADDYLHATFLDMIGDPVCNPKGWEIKKLKDISTSILNGTTPKGGSKVYVDQGILFFRSQNIWRNRILLDDVAYIDNETHRRMKKSSLENKDILITKTGRINTENSSLGRAAMFLGQDNSANINGHVYLIRLQQNILHEYVLYILTTDEYREYIRDVCVGGIDKRQINKGHLEEFPIIFPPIELQHRFATIIESVERQKQLLQKQQLEIDTLFASLTQRAFRGEL